MGVSKLRSALCWALIVIVPASLAASDSGAAMLYSKGAVWINGAEVPGSSAILPDDFVQTQDGAMATINADGASVLIASETLVKFKVNALSLEHGGVSVTTSKGMSVHVSCITVAPTSSAWTEFEVTDVNGTVHVAAHKNDVTITAGAALGASTKPTAPAKATTLHEGEATTREETAECGTAKRPTSPTPGNLLGSPYVRWGAVGAGGGLLCILLCFGGGHPSSPSDPAGSTKP